MKQVMRHTLADIAQINPPTVIPLDSDGRVAYAALSGVCPIEASVTPAHALFATLNRTVHHFQSGDLLIPIIQSGLKRKKLAQVDRQYPFGVCSKELAVIRANDLLVHPRYLLHWLRQSGCAMLLPFLRGTTVKRIGLADLQRLEIPLPPLTRQALCAQLMDTALARQEVARRQLRNAEMTTAALWQHAMQFSLASAQL